MFRVPIQAQVACATVYGACFVLLDVAVLSFVTGRVRGELGASSAEAQGFATFNQIGFFTAGVLGAYLAQRHGTKRVFLWALLVYTAGSLGCALAPDSTSFMAARLVQGLGTGMGVTSAFALLISTMGARGLGLLLPLGLYMSQVAPMVGGYLVQENSWRWLFFINLPLGALGLLLGLALLPDTPPDPTVRFDVWGWILAVGLVVCVFLTLAIAANGGYRWHLERSQVILLAITAAIFPLFVWRELTAREPLIHLRVFRRRSFRVAVVLTVFVFAQVTGTPVPMLQYLQAPSLRNLGPWSTSDELLPRAVGALPALVLALPLSARFTLRPLFVAGFGLVGLADWLLRLLDVATPDATIRLLNGIQGFGIGLLLPAAVLGWLTAVPQTEGAQVATVLNVSIRFVSALMAPLANTLLTYRTDLHTAMLGMTLRPEWPGTATLLSAGGPAALRGQIGRMASMQAIEDLYLVLSACCALGLLVALLWWRPPTAAESA